MKRWIGYTVTVMCLLAGVAVAQDRMIIFFKDGKTQDIELETIQKIEYQTGRAKGYVWVLQGTGDCPGGDIAFTGGSAIPAAQHCHEKAEGLSAVCWERGINSSCTYKSTPADLCVGGRNPGSLYKCTGVEGAGERKAVLPTPTLSIAGRWTSTEGGEITFRQAANNITGTYPLKNGRIRATLDGNVLTGHWFQDHSGQRCATMLEGTYHWGRMRLVFTENKYEGRWSYCDREPTESWRGTLLSGLPTAAEIPAVREAVPRPAGLLSLWKADGNANDSAGANHGRMMNGAALAAGRIGQAFSLDGVDDHINIPDAPAFRMSSWSLEAWVNPASFGRNDRIILGKVSQCKDFAIGIKADGKIAVWTATPGACVRHYTQTAYSVTVNTWYHVVGTYDSATSRLKLYVNGTLVGENTAPADTTNTDPLRIGNSSCCGEHFHGLVDEVAIYNRALTAKEIMDLYRW